MNFTWRMVVGGCKVHAVRPPEEVWLGEYEQRALCGLVNPKHGWCDPQPIYGGDTKVCKLCARKAKAYEGKTLSIHSMIMKLPDEILKCGLDLWARHKRNLDETISDEAVPSKRDGYDMDLAFDLQDWLWMNRGAVFAILEDHHATRP